MKPSVLYIVTIGFFNKKLLEITFEGDLMINVPKHENRVVFDKKYPVSPLFGIILYRKSKTLHDL